MAIYLGNNKIAPVITKDPLLIGYMTNGKLIATKTHSFKLSDTNFSSITPTTSNQSLTLPATTYTTSPATSIICHKLGESYDGTIINRDTHDYLVYFECFFDYVYTQSMTGTTHGIRTSLVLTNSSYTYHGLNATGEISTSTSTSSYSAPSCYPLLYQKEDNSYGSLSGYGIYINSGSYIADFYSNYINLKLSYMYVRGHATYFSIDSIQLIKPADMTLNFTWKVYEGDKNFYSNTYEYAYSKLANPTT